VSFETFPQRPSVPAYLFLGWFLGVLTLAGATAWQYVTLRRRIAAADSRDSRPVEELAASLAQRLGLRRRIRVRVSDHLSMPLVTGLFRPAIVLPARMCQNLCRLELEPVILHELVHIKRHDLLVNWLQALAQTVYFFNPVVWLAARRIRFEREQICDDRVLTILKGERQSYARSLLHALQLRQKNAPIPLGLLGLAEPHSTAFRRIHRILDERRKVMPRLSIRGPCRHRCPQRDTCGQGLAPAPSQGGRHTGSACVEG
jgi:beta-lactamase regulating signal transducer with metallopeptidase domain